MDKLKDNLRFVVVVAILLWLGYLIGSTGAPPVAYAAPSQPVAQCEAVAQTPNLSIYFCEPDGAPPFLINSYGFMVPVE